MIKALEDLKAELEKYHRKSFKKCKKMGEILQMHLELMLAKD